ncbi:MAG: hypothetical protein WCK86_01475 [Planctomycetia bacterium]
MSIRNTRLGLVCRGIVIVWGVFSATCSGAFAQSLNVPLNSDDVSTLVILAPSGPVFLELQISVGGESYRRWTGRYLSRVLDGDGNRRLSRAELSLIPRRILAFAKSADPQDIIREISEGSEAADVSSEEFIQWFNARLPKMFDLIAQPKPADDAVRLAGLLDENSDAAVSDEELSNAAKALRFRDLDNDETFTISELVPYRDPRSRNVAVTPDVVSLPFFHITDEDSLNIVAGRLLERYGREGKLEWRSLRVSDQKTASNSLDRSLLSEYLKSPEFHAGLQFQLSDKANLSDVKVEIQKSASAFLQVVSAERGRLNLVIDGMKLSLVARGGGANNRMVTRGYLGQEFSIMDADRSQSLDEMEFEGLKAALVKAGTEVDFHQIDLDEDLQMTRQELFRFADKEQAATASRVEVTVEQSGRTMFSLLDSNGDRRLTKREILKGRDRLTEYDINLDGAYSDVELGTEYVLTIGLGRSELRRMDDSGQMAGMAMMPTGDAILPGRDGLAGPNWFRLMDRNQDGDVSRREFPGTAVQFQQLDRDKDQLISVGEAETVSDSDRVSGQ